MSSSATTYGEGEFVALEPINSSYEPSSSDPRFLPIITRRHEMVSFPRFSASCEDFSREGISKNKIRLCSATLTISISENMSPKIWPYELLTRRSDEHTSEPQHII